MTYTIHTLKTNKYNIYDLVMNAVIFRGVNGLGGGGGGGVGWNTLPVKCYSRSQIDYTRSESINNIV